MEQIRELVRGLLRDPERTRNRLNRLIEDERENASRDPERDAEIWSTKLSEAEAERRRYHRLAAKGHMADEEQSAALSDLIEIRQTATRKLEAVQIRDEALRRLEGDRDALMESYAGAVKETLEDPNLKNVTGSTSCFDSAFGPPRLAIGGLGHLGGGGRRSRECFIVLQTSSTWRIKGP